MYVARHFSFDFPSFEKTRTMLIRVDMYLLPKAIRRYESLRRLVMVRFLWNRLSVIKLLSVAISSILPAIRTCNRGEKSGFTVKTQRSTLFFQ